MSSHAFHRTPDGCVQETTVEEQFKPRTLKFFEPTTQETYRGSPTTIHTTTVNPNSRSDQQVMKTHSGKTELDPALPRRQPARMASQVSRKTGLALGQVEAALNQKPRRWHGRTGTLVTGLEAQKKNHDRAICSEK
jgi:hypothetical protein